ADFGLMAMLMVVVYFLTGTADLGFEEALIQRRDATEAHRSSAFWAVLLAALLLSVGQILAAPWLAAFYGVPALAPLAIWLSLLFLLRAVGVVPRAIAGGALDLRIIVACGSVAVAVAGTCAVILAWRGFGVVSLAVEVLVAEA